MCLEKEMADLTTLSSADLADTIPILVHKIPESVETFQSIHYQTSMLLLAWRNNPRVYPPILPPTLCASKVFRRNLDSVCMLNNICCCLFFWKHSETQRYCDASRGTKVEEIPLFVKHLSALPVQSDDNLIDLCVHEVQVTSDPHCWLQSTYYWCDQLHH